MKVGRWAPVLLVVFGIAAACNNDSETNWSEPVGGTASIAGSGAGNPNQLGGGGGGGAGVGGNSIGGKNSAGTSGGGGKTEPQGGAAGSPAAGAGGDAVAGGAGGASEAGSAGAPTDPEGGAGGAAGGAAGAGGNGGEGGAEPLECEDESSVPTELPSCIAASDEAGDSCQSCLKASCCTEWQHCYGTSPQSKCGHGATPEEPGELDCLHQCYLSGLATSVDSTELLQACASTCAGACLFLAQSTNDLIDCAIDECLDECLPAQ